MIAYKDCPECGARKIHSTVRLCEVCETCEKYESKFNALIRERDEARSEAERLRDAGTVLVRSLERMTAERDKLSSERRQLRARLVECRPWVGVLPYPNTPEFSEMLAIRDLADDTLEEVQP